MGARKGRRREVWCFPLCPGRPPVGHHPGLDAGLEKRAQEDWLRFDVVPVFLPGGSLRKTLQLLRDYDRHQDIYPEVVDSKLLSSKDDTLRAYLRLVKTRVLTVVLNTEHEVQYREISPNRGFIRSRSTRISEVKNACKPDETQMPVGEDSGFLWRLNAYWRLGVCAVEHCRGLPLDYDPYNWREIRWDKNFYPILSKVSTLLWKIVPENFLRRRLLEETDYGLYVELSTVSLSRDMPSGLAWLIKPFIREVPKESLQSTLAATRQAIQP